MSSAKAAEPSPIPAAELRVDVGDSNSPPIPAAETPPLAAAAAASPSLVLDKTAPFHAFSTSRHRAGPMGLWIWVEVEANSELWACFYKDQYIVQMCKNKLLMNS